MIKEKRILQGKMEYISMPGSDDYGMKINDITTVLLAIRGSNQSKEHLVEELEDEKKLSNMHDKEYEEFSKLYTDRLLEKYLRILFKKDFYFKDALDFMRVMYGLKDVSKYPDKPKYKRYEAYYQKTNNSLLGELTTIKSIQSKVRSIEKEIIEELAKAITKDIFEKGDGKKLNLLKTDMDFRKAIDDNAVNTSKNDVRDLKNDPSISLPPIYYEDTERWIDTNKNLILGEGNAINDRMIDDLRDSDNQISDCVTKIRVSEHHDDIAEELYKALCGEGEPPYDKWVATWVLKCIKKESKGNYAMQDIMNASFALLVGNSLEKNDKEQVRRRVYDYLNHSDYIQLIKEIPYKHSFSEITDESLKEKILTIVMSDEQKYLEKLITHMKNISDPEKDIKKLKKQKKYGKFDGATKAFSHKPQKIKLAEGRLKRISSIQKATAMCSIAVLFLSMILTSRSPKAKDIYPDTNSGRPSYDIAATDNNIEYSYSIKNSTFPSSIFNTLKKNMSIFMNQ